MNNGNFSRSGAGVVLVSKESATGGRCENDPLSTFQIDENHSDMVKFSHGDHRVRVVASKLGEVSGLSLAPSIQAATPDEDGPSVSRQRGAADDHGRAEPSTRAPLISPEWDMKSGYHL